MGKKIKMWLRLALLAFGVFCAFMMMFRFIENAGGEESYDTAQQIAFHKEEDQPAAPQTEEPEEVVVVREWVPEPVEEDEHMQMLKEIDLKALQEVNPEVIGWIFIPETEINYPILQGEDNQFYLKHTWEKMENPMGSIFMEHRNTNDFADFNTILYGHNMNSGTMFADLKEFSTTWFREQTPYVYLANDQGVFRYEVFSYFKAKLDSPVYGLSFNQRQTREKLITTALEESNADLGVVPSYTDRILTLSTCSGSARDNRWVVLARLKMIRSEG